MMILGNFRLCALGVLLAGLAAPSLARAPAKPVEIAPSAPSAQSTRASQSRRVELPFPLESISPDRAPRRSAPSVNTAPHPYREDLLKLASLAEPGPAAAAIRPRLPRILEFC